jgi:Meiotically Up-regulated Gene 113 (MUG113) protein
VTLTTEEARRMMLAHPQAFGAAERAIRRELLARTSERFFLYAIQAGGDDGPVKIGTAKDPDQRLKTLQTASPVPLTGLCAWRGFSGEEAEIHQRFADHRIRGEWFRPHADLIDFVWAMDEPYWFECHRRELAEDTGEEMVA